MSDFFSTGGGKTKEKTTATGDPSAAAMQALRLQLIQSLIAGDWAPMQGFFDKVLIPRTKNELTAAGLGRSGAIGEAVATAQLSYNTDFLKSLLSGIPSSGGTTTSVSQREPGIMDWLGLALKAGSVAAAY